MLAETVAQTDGQTLPIFIYSYDTICCIDMRSKADVSQLNLPH